ncbi:L,D-transpeptidase family protein [Candidatus Ruminimicrobium bovinum]|uniref:L,D-transpeptidase family protein n=1 Tax=Candidatus Ruminimicrobium bovinum TaxID=3242779 RepID=UPI0039B8EBF6
MNIKKISILIFLYVCVNCFAQTNNELFIDKNPIPNKYRNDETVQQIIYVNFVENSNALFKMYVRDKKQNNGWKLVLETDAFIGKNGFGKQTEGDLKTPIGEFNVTKAFGIKKNPGTKLKYLKINNNLYACDENCEYYNQIIDSKKTKHQCKGEHLIDYYPQYNYGLCIDFNSENIYPNGSNIFIHVKGNKDYTAGCIAIDEKSMITVLKNSTNKTKIIIY